MANNFTAALWRIHWYRRTGAFAALGLDEGLTFFRRNVISWLTVWVDSVPTWAAGHPCVRRSRPCCVRIATDPGTNRCYEEGYRLLSVHPPASKSDRLLQVRASHV